MRLSEAAAALMLTLTSEETKGKSADRTKEKESKVAGLTTSERILKTRLEASESTSFTCSSPAVEVKSDRLAASLTFSPETTISCADVITKFTLIQAFTSNSSAGWRVRYSTVFS
eukprot:768672-Hanusia_phi.AAC.6